MSHQMRIRTALVTYLSVAIFVFGGTIWAVMYWSQRKLARRSSNDEIQLQLRLADQRLRAFFDPVVRDVELLRQMGNRSQVNVDDPETLAPLFATLLGENPQASAVMVADERGHEFFLGRDGNDWTSRQTRRDEWNDRQTIATWRAAGNPTVNEVVSTYDPRKRPWFRATLRKDQSGENAGEMEAVSKVYWTRPYWFFSKKEPGITASAAFRDAEGRNCAVAMDVLLSDLREFTRTVNVGGHGSLAFLDNYGWPVDSPEVLTEPDAELESHPPTERAFARPEVFAAVSALDFQSQPEQPALRFVHAGKTWWADAEPFRLSARRQWQVVVVVPESDFMSAWASIQLWVTGVTLMVLVGAVYWAVRFADRLSRPLEALAQNSERITQGQIDHPVTIASNLMEVSELASAQETMRVSLRSLLKIERDLQIAREIQQSTLPRTFPRTDKFDIAAWSEPAEQTGGDTLEVIATQREGSATPTVHLLLADASGHGIGPALCAVRIHALFRVAIDECDSAADIAGLINRQLCRTQPAGHFATAWVARLNPVDKTLDSFSAGQGPILWFRAIDGEVDVVRIADGLPCGITEDQEPRRGKTQSFARGDILAVISDGIFEATNEAGERFGVDRVARIVRSRHHCSAGEILAGVREAVVQHAGASAASDDRTIIIVKCVRD